MHLSDLWFIAIAVLWAGYFVLEGFDFGVGILLPVLGRDDAERRAMINTIGPVWDGNEVWLLTAGGATFAAFPGWYATMFCALLPAAAADPGRADLRGVAFEYRGKRDSARWRRALGRGDLRRLAAARAAVGRRVRQRAARHPARTPRTTTPATSSPAQPLRAARRADHAAAVHAARRAVPRPEDHRRPARRAARRAGLAVGLARHRGRRRLPGLDRASYRSPGHVATGVASVLLAARGRGRADRRRSLANLRAAARATRSPRAAAAIAAATAALFTAPLPERAAVLDQPRLHA